MDARKAIEAAARSRAYAFLAEAFADPEPATLARVRRALPDAEAALAQIGAADSLAALADVRAEFDGTDDEGIAAHHRRAFGHIVSGDCSPYEGEYGQAHIFQKTQCLADNAGFFRAFGLEPAPDLHDRIDHVSVELEFLHVLAAKEAHAVVAGHGDDRRLVVRDATLKYFERHLGRWAPSFAARLAGKAETGPYAALARLLTAFLAEEARALHATVSPADYVELGLPGGDEPAACEGCAAASAFNPDTRGEP